MPIYLSYSYLLQTLMSISSHKCLPLRVKQPLFPLLTTVVNKEYRGRVVAMVCYAWAMSPWNSLALEHGTALYRIVIVSQETIGMLQPLVTC